jgi:hypothetical protein
MSIKEKNLEAERREHISVDEGHHSSKDGGIDIEQALDQPHDTEQSPTDDKETRRIIRKVDLRLLPTLAAIYAFALIDRVNLPNVRCLLFLSNLFS